MILITSENKARRIFERYPKVAAFTFGDKKGISENGLEISYAKLNFLPDQDEINGVISGDIKLSKLVKRTVNAIHEPTKAKNKGLCLSIAQLINMVNPIRSKSKMPVLIVFITDDAEGAVKKNRILTKYVRELFQAFGIRVLRGKDAAKFAEKCFKGKPCCEDWSAKKSKRRVAENAERILKYAKKHPECRISKTGYQLQKMLITMFALELSQSSISAIGLDQLGRRDRDSLVRELVNTYTNDNLKTICELGMKDKPEGLMCKKLSKKNKKAVESYMELRELVKTVDPELKLPKVESGYGKKKKKKGKKSDKPRLNSKKFIKYFAKSSHLGMLGLVYGHTTMRTMGVDPGTRDYNKHIAPALALVAEREGAEFPKAFTQAAKALNEANNTSTT